MCYCVVKCVKEVRISGGRMREWPIEYGWLVVWFGCLIGHFERQVTNHK